MLVAASILSLHLTMLEWLKSGPHRDLEYGREGYREKADFLADKYGVEKIEVTQQVELNSERAIK